MTGPSARWDRSRKRRPGFTLMELVVSVAIATVLMGGIASAIVVAGHALPNRGSTAETLVRSAAEVDRIAGELYCALTFTERTATSFEIKIPDRDLDLAPETIRYAWSGTPGDPLTRQYNAGAVVTVAEDVQKFDVSYVTRSVTATETSTTVTASGEGLLAFFDGWAGKTETAQNVGVDSSDWAAEFFSATSIPGTATKVTITRVLLKLRQGALGGAGTFSVAIHRSKGGGNPDPRATPIGTPVVGSGADLSGSYLWEEFSFADVSLKNANKDYVIVVKGTAAPGTQADAEILRYYVSKAPKVDSNALWTSDVGAKWEPKKNVAKDYQFPFYVYGEYETTSTVPIDVTRYFLTSVGLALQVGADAATRVETAAQVLNQPEVIAP